jgi:hypothetical protein
MGSLNLERRLFRLLDEGGGEVMDRDRTWQAQLEIFMQSELAETVMRPGSEAMFAREVEAFIRMLDLDRWEGDPEYLEAALGQFLEHELDAGHLDPPNLDEMGLEPGLWDILQGIAATALDARYEAEVVRGVREDMRVPPEDAREAVITEAPRSLTDRIETLMQVIADFVRGREAPERGDELGR